MLALQQSATASSGGQKSLSITNKRVAQADVAPGLRKKPHYFNAQVVVSSSSDTDSDEDLAKPFDPHTFYSNSSRKKLPKSLEKYVRTHFRLCLSNPVRKAMTKERPLLALEADDAIVDFMGKNFPANETAQPAIVQRFGEIRFIYKGMQRYSCCSYNYILLYSVIKITIIMFTVSNSFVITYEVVAIVAN